MDGLQWLIIAAAGIAGYAAVSWIIGRRRSPEPPPRGPLPDAGAAGAAENAATSTDPAAAPPPFRSAWDELNNKR